MSHLASAETKGLFKTVVRARGEATDKAADMQSVVRDALTMEEEGPGFGKLPGMHMTDQSVSNLPNRKRV